MKNPKIISEKEVYGGWLRVVRFKIQHPNGNIGTYDIVNPGSHSVSVVAFDEYHQVILIELYRFGQNQRLLELPAGGVKHSENPEIAIERELLEETGYQGKIQKIGEHYIAAEHGVTRHVFIALDCRKVSHPLYEDTEINEGARVVLLSLEAFKAHIRAGKTTEIGAAFMALDFLKML